jgi:integrase
VLALRWSDVDPEAGTLRIKRALSDGEFVTPKTPRSRRKIELSNTARAALRAHRKLQLEEQMRKAGLWKDHGLVFPSTVGTPLSHRTPSQRRALVQGAAEARWSAHRHPTLRPPPYLCDAATQQQRPSQVRLGLLGHASIAQTLDTYSHVLKGMDGGIGNAMDATLGWSWLYSSLCSLDGLVSVPLLRSAQPKAC